MSEKIYFSCKREDLRKDGGKSFEKGLKEWLDAFKKELSGVCVWMGSVELEGTKTDKYTAVTTSVDNLYDKFLSRTRGHSVYKKDGATFLFCDFEDGEICLEGRRLLPDIEKKCKNFVLDKDASTLARSIWVTEMFRDEACSRPLDLEKAKKNISFDERDR